MKPAMRRSSVVLPHPLGPSNVLSLPSGIVRLTFETAAVLPNALERPISSTWASGIEDGCEGALSARDTPHQCNGEEGYRQKRRGKSGSRFQPIVTYEAQDREGRDLRSRCDEKDRDAQIGDRT